MSNKKAKNKNKKRRERERERERLRGKKRKTKMLLAASKKCSLPSYLALESFNRLRYKTLQEKRIWSPNNRKFVGFLFGLLHLFSSKQTQLLLPFYSKDTKYIVT